MWSLDSLPLSKCGNQRMKPVKLEPSGEDKIKYSHQLTLDEHLPCEIMMLVLLAILDVGRHTMCICIHLGLLPSYICPGR